MLKTKLLSKAPDTYLAHTLTEGRCSTKLASPPPPDYSPSPYPSPYTAARASASKKAFLLGLDSTWADGNSIFTNRTSPAGDPE